jgi:hypothetical protein
VQRRVAPGKATLTGTLGGGAAASAVQRRSAAGEGASPAGTSGGEAGVHAVAAAGFGGAVSQLPYHETIQRAFGPYDVSGVAAYTDGRAQRAAEAMGAEAYASGERVAFGKAPDLHTAAHEAAHVVQQRAGVALAGGVGQRGDGYEQVADGVADAVVRGESAVPLLDQSAGASAAVSATVGGGAVQRKVPPEQQDAVRAHVRNLARWHGLPEEVAGAALDEAIEAAASAEEAIALLDQRLDPAVTLKALVRRGDLQGALDQVRRDHQPASSTAFVLHPIDDYRKVVKNEAEIPPGTPFGVTVPGVKAEEGKRVIYVHEKWIRQWILEDQLGSLLNTIEHEATHARQGVSCGPFNLDDDAGELEAYTHEILLAAQKARTGARLLPTQAQLAKAFRAAQKHYARLEAKVGDGDDLRPYRVRWERAQKEYHEVERALQVRDEARQTSRFEERRFHELAARYLKLGEQLMKLANAGCSIASPALAALDGKATPLHLDVLGSSQELHPDAAARIQPMLARVEELEEDFKIFKYQGPQCYLARKGCGRGAARGGGGGGGGLGGEGPSSSSLRLLAPPPGSGALLPPPGGASSAAPRSSPPSQPPSQPREPVGPGEGATKSAADRVADDEEDWSAFSGAAQGPAPSATSAGGVSQSSSVTSASGASQSYSVTSASGPVTFGGGGGGPAPAPGGEHAEDDWGDFASAGPAPAPDGAAGDDDWGDFSSVASPASASGGPAAPSGEAKQADDDDDAEWAAFAAARRGEGTGGAGGSADDAS